MTGEIFEVDGIIPNTDTAETLESFDFGNGIWDIEVLGSLRRKYGTFSVEKLPDKDVYEKSRKIKVLGGEKASVCYSPKLPFNVDVFEVIRYGKDYATQPADVSKLAAEIIMQNKISEGDVILCPDHGLGALIQMQAKHPDTIVDFDWHADKKHFMQYNRGSWVYYMRNNPELFGFKERPVVIRTKTKLMNGMLDKIKGNVAITVCMDVLNPYFADAVLELRKNGGMELEDLLSDIGMLQKRNNVVSLSVCERRRVLDDEENTACTVRDVVEGFLKH